MKFGVVVFPGTWSDCDFHHVVSEVLHQPVKYVWHRERELGDVDCVILPGGFSYGDYLRAGAVAGRSPVVDAFGRSRPRAGSSSARATASRSSAKRACCPAPYCGTSASSTAASPRISWSTTSTRRS